MQLLEGSGVLLCNSLKDLEFYCIYGFVIYMHVLANELYCDGYRKYQNLAVPVSMVLVHTRTRPHK